MITHAENSRETSEQTIDLAHLGLVLILYLLAHRWSQQQSNIRHGEVALITKKNNVTRRNLWNKSNVPQECSLRRKIISCDNTRIEALPFVFKTFGIFASWVIHIVTDSFISYRTMYGNWLAHFRDACTNHPASNQDTIVDGVRGRRVLVQHFATRCMCDTACVICAGAISIWIIGGAMPAMWGRGCSARARMRCEEDARGGHAAADSRSLFLQTDRKGQSGPVYG